MEHIARTTMPVRRREHALLWLTVAHALVACGGGSSSSAVAPQAGEPPTAPPGEHAATATLNWSASPSDAVVGYRVYHGTAPGHYRQAKGAGTDVGLVTSHVVTGLARGTRYHFAVTAYAASGSESNYSAEASKVVD
jgi:hypothetical protein